MPPFQNNTSLVVQRLDRATDLVVSAGLPVKCLVFPATGGLQAIDAAGNILPLVGPSGSLIPSADNADNLGDFLTPLRWANGYFAGSVMAAQLTSFVSGTPNVSSLMVKFTPVASSVNYVNITNAIVNNAPIVAANGADANVNLRLAGKGSGAVNPQSPLVITPTVRSGDAATTGALEIIGAANTAVTAETEAPDVFFDLARTVTWAAGAGPLSDQRAVRITAPTYAGNAGTPLIITSAASFYINDAPTQGANMTLTNTYALWVDAGRVRFDGAVVQNVYPVLQTTGTLASPVTTINTPAGVTVVANGATTVTVTCAACTTATLITAVVLNTTTNTTTIQSVEPGAGSFVVRLTANPGVSTAIIGVRISQPGTGV
jgi:hypothetical protein